MKLEIIITLLFITLFFGCSSSTDPNYDKYYDSAKDLDAKSAIALANDWKFSEPKIKSHADSKELTIEFPDGRQLKKQIPDSVMYIAIAPYVEKTHVCETHYMSSCSGELTEKTLHLTIKKNNGQTTFDGDINTLKNGFFELWLPRNNIFSLHITYNSMSVDGDITTYNGANTCITTLKLK